MNKAKAFYLAIIYYKKDKLVNKNKTNYFSFFTLTYSHKKDCQMAVLKYYSFSGISLISESSAGTLLIDEVGLLLAEDAGFVFTGFFVVVGCGFDDAGLDDVVLGAVVV